MDWKWTWRVIKRNSEALKGIIEVLFALLGLDGADAASRIPRSLHSAVLGVLRPAESAVRRLDRHCRPERCGETGSLASHAAGGSRSEKVAEFQGLSFQLFDPRKDVPELRPRPHEIHEASPAHPFHRAPIPGSIALFPAPRPVVDPRRRPMAGSTPNAPYPQAPGPQVRP